MCINMMDCVVWMYKKYDTFGFSITRSFDVSTTSAMLFKSVIDGFLMFNDVDFVVYLRVILMCEGIVGGVLCVFFFIIDYNAR